MSIQKTAVYLLCILWAFCNCMIRTYKVPYDYLATLNVATGRYRTSDFFNATLIENLDRICLHSICYLPVYHSPLNITDTSFVALDGKPNNYLNPIYPNWLWFDETQYEYSFIYESEGTGQCSDPRLWNFSLPECPNGWEMFARTNGKRWCFKIFYSENTTWNDSQSKCLQLGASLNGIETFAEYEYFANHTFGEIANHPSVNSSDASNNRCAIGGFRNCIQDDCSSTKLQWLNNVSRNNPVQLYTNTPNFGKTGNCLTFSVELASYDVVQCDHLMNFYSCGKFADIMETQNGFNGDA